MPYELVENPEDFYYILLKSMDYIYKLIERGFSFSYYKKCWILRQKDGNRHKGF